jgi:predicted RNase H-like nuclease (RuvC/YqgF family)
LKNKVETLKNIVETLKNKVETLKNKVETLKNKVKTLKNKAGDQNHLKSISVGRRHLTFCCHQVKTHVIKGR